MSEALADQNARPRRTLRKWLQDHPPRRRRRLSDWIVAYYVPTWLWRAWARWFWGDAPSSCDDCPECQKIEAARPGSIYERR